jgi:restriction system protein
MPDNPDPPWFPMVQDSSAALVAHALAERHRHFAAATFAGSGTLGSPLPLVAGPDLPGLLMQTVIVPGEKTAEGTLIAAVAVPWFDIVEKVLADPAIAFQLPWEKWEEIIAGAYKKAGFDEVTLTPRSGDAGRDVIAVKKGLGFVRVIDQVKAYKPPHLVTANDVRALVGVLEMDGASKGFLTTTSDFAPRIKEDPLILRIPVGRLQLINGTELAAALAKLVKSNG